MAASTSMRRHVDHMQSPTTAEQLAAFPTALVELGYRKLREINEE